MGTGSSKQRMGERVKTGRSKRDQDLQLRDERVEMMTTSSPETLQVAVDGILEALSLCSPFLEGTLLTAIKAEPKKVEQRLLLTTKKVLTAPIDKDEYQWFRQFVLSSSVWFLRNADDTKFLYKELMETATGLSKHIMIEMDSIYDHLKTHKDWKKLMSIKNQSFVSRQDHDDVGLLKDDGITAVLELKEQEDDASNHQKLKGFVESNLVFGKPHFTDVFPPLRRHAVKGW